MYRQFFDSLGDVQKGYEKNTPNIFMKSLPIIVRLDGRKFSKWTKGLRYPYDERFQQVKEELLIYMSKKINARCAFSQSDEFTFLLYHDNINSELHFGGVRDKINTTIASEFSVKFNELVKEHIPEKADQLASFDCRSYQVPNLTEAAKSFLWREMDCSRNSVSMLARAHFSHREVMGKGRKQMLDMLLEKGVIWNDTPQHFRRGSYVKRVKYQKYVEFHQSYVEASKFDVCEMPPLYHFEKGRIVIDEKIVENIFSL